MSSGIRNPSYKDLPDEVCRRITSAQFGVLTGAQALAAGLSKFAISRRLQTGEWQRIHPGVYRLAGAPPSWRQRLLAACLWAGDGAAASQRAAAVLWGLEGFTAAPVEISTTRNLVAPDVVVHRVQRLGPGHVTTIDGIPVTTVARTLLDLGAVAEKELVGRALDDALRRRLVSLPRLRWVASREGGGGPGKRGSGVLRQLLDERRPGQAPPESVLETRVIKLLAHSGLPEPERQFEIRDKGRLVARVDLAYPQARFAIEADGYAYHSSHAAWRRDRVRRNALTALGWRVLHVTWKDLNERPGDIVAEIGAGIAKTPDP